MVQSGFPELPGDNDESLQTTGIHITNYGQNTSDESDDEGVGVSYDGYEPLPLADSDEPQTLDDSQNIMQQEDLHPVSSNLPSIVRSDVEIEQQVWNAPRPELLSLELDNSRTEQIMSAMANITLPNSAIPEWAQEIPEERWKQELLERIRQRKVTPSNGEGTSK